MTLLVVMSENICGYIIYLFIYFCCPFYFPYLPTLLCVFLLRNKELEEIHDCVQSQLRWEEVGRENWGNKIFLIAQMPGSGIRVVETVFFPPL